MQTDDDVAHSFAKSWDNGLVASRLVAAAVAAPPTLPPALQVTALWRILVCRGVDCLRSMESAVLTGFSHVLASMFMSTGDAAVAAACTWLLEVLLRDCGVSHTVVDCVRFIKALFVAVEAEDTEPEVGTTAVFLLRELCRRGDQRHMFETDDGRYRLLAKALCSDDEGRTRCLVHWALDLLNSPVRCTGGLLDFATAVVAFTSRNVVATEELAAAAFAAAVRLLAQQSKRRAVPAGVACQIVDTCMKLLTHVETPAAAAAAAWTSLCFMTRVAGFCEDMVHDAAGFADAVTTYIRKCKRSGRVQEGDVALVIVLRWLCRDNKVLQKCTSALLLAEEVCETLVRRKDLQCVFHADTAAVGSFGTFAVEDTLQRMGLFLDLVLCKHPSFSEVACSRQGLLSAVSQLSCPEFGLSSLHWEKGRAAFQRVAAALGTVHVDVRRSLLEHLPSSIAAKCCVCFDASAADAAAADAAAADAAAADAAAADAAAADADVVVLPCWHACHRGCISKWVLERHQDSCPLCRASILSNISDLLCGTICEEEVI